MRWGGGDGSTGWPYCADGPHKAAASKYRPWSGPPPARPQWAPGIPDWMGSRRGMEPFSTACQTAMSMGIPEWVRVGGGDLGRPTNRRGVETFSVSPQRGFMFEGPPHRRLGERGRSDRRPPGEGGTTTPLCSEGGYLREKGKKRSH